MLMLTEKRFSFTLADYPADTFAVVEFQGEETFSELPTLELVLVSKSRDIALDEVLDSAGCLTYHWEVGVGYQRGVVEQFEILHAYGEYVFHKAFLRPRLWWLTQSIGSAVFLNKTIPEIMHDVLLDNGLSSLDFEFNFTRTYPVREYVCQYQQTPYDFLKWWMEREGIYFFFQHRKLRDRVIFTDTHMAHKPTAVALDIPYLPPQGPRPPVSQTGVHAFSCLRRAVAQSVRVKDYNYRTPDLNIQSTAHVSDRGAGESYEYGGHFQSPGEAEDLARIRAEELACKEQEHHGRSNAPWIRAGWEFTLKDHFRQAYNQPYVSSRVTQRGNQYAYLASDLRKAWNNDEHAPVYENTFTAIPHTTQFRPERTARRPRICGAMNARVDSVDGLSQSEYAQMDDQGRYKVVLPFDLSGAGQGAGSAWVRMAQPFAGPECGMHFPLHKGTEVLLTHIDGNPDRPIIMGAAPNPEHPSVVQAGTKTRAGFRTAGGGQIYANDDKGHEHMLIKAGDDESVIRMGAGSESHVSASSKWISYSGKGAASLVGMLGCHEITWAGASYCSGLKWALAATALKSWLLKATPKILESSEDSKNDFLLKSLAAVTLSFGTLIPYAYGRRLVKSVLNTISDVVNDDIAIIGEDAKKIGYGVVSHKDGGAKGASYVFVNSKQPNILLSTDTGRMFSFANKKYSISSNDKAHFGAQYRMELIARAGQAKVTGHDITLRKLRTAGGAQPEAEIRLDSLGDVKIQQTSDNTRGVTLVQSRKGVILKVVNENGKSNQICFGPDGITVSVEDFEKFLQPRIMVSMDDDTFVELTPSGVNVVAEEILFQTGASTYTFTPKGANLDNKLIEDGPKQTIAAQKVRLN